MGGGNACSASLSSFRYPDEKRGHRISSPPDPGVAKERRENCGKPVAFTSLQGVMVKVKQNRANSAAGGKARALPPRDDTLSTTENCQGGKPQHDIGTSTGELPPVKGKVNSTNAVRWIQKGELGTQGPNTRRKSRDDLEKQREEDIEGSLKRNLSRRRS